MCTNSFNRRIMTGLIWRQISHARQKFFRVKYVPNNMKSFSSPKNFIHIYLYIQCKHASVKYLGSKNLRMHLESTRRWIISCQYHQKTLPYSRLQPFVQKAVISKRKKTIETVHNSWASVYIKLWSFASLQYFHVHF